MAWPKHRHYSSNNNITISNFLILAKWPSTGDNWYLVRYSLSVYVKDLPKQQSAEQHLLWFHEPTPTLKSLQPNQLTCKTQFTINNLDNEL